MTQLASWKGPTAGLARVVVALVALLGSGALVAAQTPGKVDLEVAELAAELIGAPVFSADGQEIGVLADLSMREEERVDRIRVSTAAALGLGSRVVEIPEGAFLLLRGAVVLDIPAESIDVLPSAIAQESR